MLADRCAGYDVWVRCGCVVISFGHDGDPDNIPAGVAIILNASVFDISDIARVWAPDARALCERVGYVRLKRHDFDVNFTTAYPPPMDQKGKVRSIVSRIYDTLDRLQNTNMFNPNCSINIQGIDANGHIVFTKDPGTNFWYPGGSDSIGAFDPENENVMGKIFRIFLERHSLVAINTFFDTGKKRLHTFWKHD